MDNNTFTTFGNEFALDTTNIHATPIGGGKVGRATAMPIAPTTSGTEALILGGIDWTVEAHNLADHFEAPNAMHTTISTRSDTGGIVGINGKKHHIIQNDVLAEFGDAIRQVRPDASYVCGGEKNGGQTTFLMLELADGLQIGGGDEIRRQILIGTHHNGGKLFAAAVQFRPFCTNQWSGLMKGRQRLVEVPHTASAEQRIKQAVYTLEAAVTTFDEWDRGLRYLLEQKTSLGAHVAQIAGAMPAEGRARTEWSNRIDRLWAEYSQDFNNDLVGTALGVVMAAQGADEHTSRVKKGQRDEQRIGRMITANYPLAARALVSVS